MTEQINQLSNRIGVASGEMIADLVIKHARIIDVFNGEIIEGDVAISDGMILGIGHYEGKNVIDAQGQYLCPGFIDGHVHIESSMLPPHEFERIVLPHGVTTVITDPHEIANVSGIEGVDYMIKSTKELTLDAYVMLPSCVPATPFENAGAVLHAEDLQPYLSEPHVLGLAEVMDYPSLRSQSPSMLKKIAMQKSMKIDGHLAGLDAEAINIYRAAGIDTDHECQTAEEALERIRRGMYVMIREGSVSRNLSSLISAVTPQNARRFLFCTDDKHVDDLLDEGSIDHNIRLAIQHGMSPVQAIQMATINAAECYHLHQKGAIAPGYEADFVLLNDLETLQISEVYKFGKKVDVHQKTPSTKNENQALTKTVHIHDMTEEQLQIPIDETLNANIIDIIPNNLVTQKKRSKVETSDGVFLPSTTEDLLKLVVVERHHKTGNVGLGIVKGFTLQEGAIATTIAHDSHNIVAVGTNDQDLLAAIQQLQTMNGGLVVVKGQEVVSSLSLSIGGLMSTDPYQKVYHQLLHVKQSLDTLGFQGSFNPFLTLSFLTLPVIPSLKLTDLGLFDTETGNHIPLQVSS